MLLEHGAATRSDGPYKAYKLILLVAAAGAAVVNEQAFGKVNQEWMRRVALDGETL